MVNDNNDNHNDDDDDDESHKNMFYKTENRYRWCM